jgi:hypothetical protein
MQPNHRWYHLRIQFYLFLTEEYHDTDAIQTNCYRYEGDKASFLCSPAPTAKNCTELHPFLQLFDHQSAEQFGHSITLSVFLFVPLNTPIYRTKCELFSLADLSYAFQHPTLLFDNIRSSSQHSFSFFLHFCIISSFFFFILFPLL